MIHIIGAGMIGLSLGWRLQLAGIPVTVYDRGSAGQEASRAAAGMIAPSGGPDPHFDIMVASRERWPEFAAELEEMSGLSIGYVATGNLSVVIDEQSYEIAKRDHEAFTNRGFAPQWLDAKQTRELVPELSKKTTGACLNRYWHFVDNRLANKALAIAFARAGGLLRETHEVTELHHASGRVNGITVNGSNVAAETVILCAGAWSDLIAGLPEAARPRMVPYKGQMVSVTMPKTSLSDFMIARPMGTTVPHLDGTLAISGTKEKGIANRICEAGVVSALLEDAARFLPGIRQLPFKETWTGIRPGTEDGKAYLGPTPLEGFHLATGHYMDGILMAPITADLVSKAIRTGTVPEAIRPFNVSRHQ